MFCRSLTVLGATVLWTSIVGPLRAEITADQVRQSIEGGVSFLKRQQAKDGSWGEVASYKGGVTSLCTLALLNSGVEPSDPSIRIALDQLRKIRTDRTYTVALQTMVFARAEPGRDAALIGRNVRVARGEPGQDRSRQRGLGVSGVARRQLELAVCPTGSARCGARRRAR